MSKPILVEEVYQVPVATVWRAITDADEMRNWYFDLPEFRPEKGFNFQFSGGPPEGIQYLHLCEVTEAVPQQKLAYSWRYDGYPGNSFVCFELFPEGENSRLRLTHIGLESFPEENADFDAKNFQMGWDDIIHRSLKEYLQKVKS